MDHHDSNLNHNENFNKGGKQSHIILKNQLNLLSI